MNNILHKIFLMLLFIMYIYPMAHAKDLKGQIFERLTVIKKVGKKSTYLTWECVCVCGNTVITTSTDLSRGRKKSCGCLQKEAQKDKTHQIKHGLTINGASTSEYGTWSMMKQRCYNGNSSKYKFYGGKGIKVCDRWRTSFVNFLEDMGEKPKPKKKFSIERINTYGDYEPNNCRWATKSEQVSNMRSNVYINYQGEIFTLAQIGRKLGMKHNCASYYYRKYGKEKFMQDIIPKYEALCS